MAPWGPILLAAALVLGGCGIAAVPGTPDTAGSGPETSTAASPSAAQQDDVRFDRSAQAVVLSVEHTEATVAGVQGRTSTTVYGDGRVVRSRDQGPGRQQRISPESMQDLMNHAAKLRGSADPGTPVTDVGWTEVSFTIDGTKTRIRMGDVPGGAQSGTDDSPEGRTRAAVQALVHRLGSLPGSTAPVPSLPPEPTR